MTGIKKQQEAWDSFPVHQTPVMTHAAHPVTTEVPPGYDGSTNWFKYADAVEEWCDLTKMEAKRRGPAIAARLSGRAEIFKERLDKERLRDPETGVDYFLATLAAILRQGASVCVLASLLSNAAMQQRSNRSSTLDGEVRDRPPEGYRCMA